MDQQKFMFEKMQESLPRSQRLAGAENLYFAHFHVGKGHATVAMLKTTDGPQVRTTWAIAFCAPEDQFSRSAGRQKSREDLFMGINMDGIPERRRASVRFHQLLRNPLLTSPDVRLFNLPRHETCEAVLALQLKHRKLSWFNPKKDKIEPVTRGRAKKRLGNLKTVEETK